MINFGSKNHSELDLLKIAQFHYKQAALKYDEKEYENAARSFSVAEIYETRAMQAKKGN